MISTASNAEEADRIARTLVEEQLAACASLIPAAQSIFRWQGKVEEAYETILLIKTSAERLDALEARLHQLHSYSCPELLSIRVDEGSQGYLAWLMECLQKPGAEG